VTLTDDAVWIEVRDEMTTENTTPATLEVHGLHATVEGKPILRGIDLTIRQGEIHALMGPNGSGKSTLSNVIMGRPGYVVTEGQVLLDGENITPLTADARAKRGLFLAMQYRRRSRACPW
jgi:Fe-S cluster assembly ATP-binding protein